MLIEKRAEEINYWKIIIILIILCLAISHYLSHLAHHLLILLVKSHLQLYPCPLQINYLWNLGFREIYYGWYLRYFHSNGASFIFIFLFIHIGRAIYYGSYFPEGLQTVLYLLYLFLGLLPSVLLLFSNLNSCLYIFHIYINNSNFEEILFLEIYFSIYYINI